MTTIATESTAFLKALCRLWSESHDEDDFCQKAAGLWRESMDDVMGTVTRKLQAQRLLTLNLKNAYDLGELSLSLCTIVAQAMGTEAAFLYHKEGEGLRLVEDLAVVKPSGGSWRELLARAASSADTSVLPIAESGLLAEVMASGKTAAVTDLAHMVPQVRGLSDRGLASVAAAPLVTPREELGVLVVGTATARVFSPAELETLEEFAQAATGALLISRLYATARQESERASSLVAQLRELTRATQAVGKSLDIHRTCQELVSQVPRFLTPLLGVDVFLCKGDDWSLTSGSGSSFSTPPAAWLYFLDKTGYPPSLELPREILAETPFEQTGHVLVFPMRKQDDWLGLVVVASEQEPGAVSRDMVETLVNHTSSALVNAIAWQKEHERSITDGLTGVYNRRYFNQRMIEEKHKADRYKRPFSLVLLDIDHFKMCNDLLGHLGGDRMLKQLATVLRNNTRTVDIVARYGGEEFAVILPETGVEGAGMVAEKLRALIDQFPFRDQEQLPAGNATASLGFSTYSLHGPTIENLIQVADAALYSAKEAGRNRVGQPPIPESSHL